MVLPPFSKTTCRQSAVSRRTSLRTIEPQVAGKRLCGPNQGFYSGTGDIVPAHIVKLDGRCYHIDVTWNGCIKTESDLSHNCFNLNDDGLDRGPVLCLKS